MYLQLLLEELGYAVTNLGGCVPDDLLVDECRSIAPDLVVISTVNGHGYTEGLRIAPRLRSCPELAGTVLTIGGKLDTDGTHAPERRNLLLAAGFDAIANAVINAVVDSGPTDNCRDEPNTAYTSSEPVIAHRPATGDSPATSA